MSTKFVLKQDSPQRQAKNNPTLAEYVFDGNMFTVGSDEANNIVLPDTAAEQAVIVREDEHLTLINGAEGTSLNEQALRREAIQPLVDGDEIRIGNFVILIVENESNPPAATTRLRSSDAAEQDFARTSETVVSPVFEPARQTENPVNNSKTNRNFAAVLDTLRTEEDSFYFIITDAGGARETGRVLLERAETPLGANAGNEFAFEIERITSLFAVARKDWSGILLESRRRNSVFVNGEAVETSRRLRNDDRITFSAPLKSSLILHEPSLLVALEPLLSARTDNGGGGLNNGRQTLAAAAGSQTTAIVPAAKTSLFERRFFGYFSFVETVSMLIGTLIAAVLFFLFFEFMFS